MKGTYFLAGFIFQALCVSSMHIEKIPATPCNSTVCKLPDCYCSGTDIPGNLPPTDTPQFVLLTFDDGVTIGNIDYYRESLRNRKNPNNCSISATFFISHEYTDYSLVHELNAEGHEIALHSMSHVTALDYWTNADVATLKKEFVDQRTFTAKFANMTESEIKGIRMPFLQMAGNNQYQMLKENNFLYDFSWTTQKFMTPGLWPYTMKYASIQDCPIGKCPTDSFPNLWTLPMINWKDQIGNVCAMLDACVNVPNTSDGLLDWMKGEFNKQYTGNRAPVGLFTHAAWFTASEVRFDAYKRFLDYLATLKDVFIVKSSQVIDWIREPKTVDQMLADPITCHRVVPPTCIRKPCLINIDGVERYFTVCAIECPDSFP